jgi:alpha-mannosidase
VGYDSHYGLPCSERGMGKNRLLHFFNTTQYDYEGVVTFTVFDWGYDVTRATFTATDGSTAPFTLLSDGAMYWGHQYKVFAMLAKVPAFGYASYTLTEAPATPAKIPPLFAERTDDYTDDDIVLENEHLRAVFARNTMLLRSLAEKDGGKELIAAPAGAFRLITESAVRGMTSWRVGNYMRVETINEAQNVRVSEVRTGGVRQWVKFDCPFATRSHLEVTVSLDAGSPMLQYDVKVDFHEVGTPEGGIPQLNFALPLGYASDSCRFDVPFGTIDRAPLDYDVPASSFAVPLSGEGGCSLMLISDCKYGFRYARDCVALSLIRASYDPDPYPEYGIHHIRLGVGVCTPGEGDRDLYRAAAGFVHPVSYCTANLQQRDGHLPLDGRFLTAEGEIRITALKSPEEGEGKILRFACTGKESGTYRLTFSKPVKEAYAVDFNEHILHPLPVEGCTVSGETAPYAICTVLVKTEV